jgi:hypothetical protein
MGMRATNNTDGGEQMNWTVKNVKSWMGRDGVGTTCTLYRDGKKVADCRDDGNGGQMDIDWADYKAPRVAINTTILDYDSPKESRKEKEWTYNGTPEEKLLAEYANGQTYVSEYGDNMTMRKDSGWIVSDLCDAKDREKEAKRRAKALKTKTLFVLNVKGVETEYSINAPYTPEMKARLEKENGTKLVRIVNTEFVDAGEAEILKRRKSNERIRRQCRTKTLYKLTTDDEGRYWVCKRPYNAIVAAQLRAKYGAKLVEIYNETFAA